MTERRTGRLPQAFAKAFAAELNAMMKDAALTGERLAELLGRSTGYVSDRRNGNAAWTTDDIDVIASALGTDALELMIQVISEAERKARERDGNAFLEGARDMAERIANRQAATVRDEGEPITPESGPEPASQPTRVGRRSSK